MNQIKKLELPELKQIYKAYVRHDFPRSERRPFSSMEKMTNEGKYASYGYYGNGGLLAYACFILTEDVYCEIYRPAYGRLCKPYKWDKKNAGQSTQAQ